MKRFALLSAMFVIAINLSGCATKQTKEAEVIYDQCNFPNTKVKAPDWVCDKPVAGWAVTAPGTAAKTAAGYSFQKQMAMTDARVQLAQQVKIQVSNMVKQFAETTGTGDRETVDRVNASVTRQITDQSLSGSKAVVSVTAPDGSLWVLVGLDQKAIEEITKSAVKTSMNNEAAMWQKLQAKKSMDELAEEVAKQRVEASL